MYLDLLGLLWICGAIVGYMAASSKGWSPAAGILGGLLLGIFSPLMFLCNSASGGKPERIKCPHCAEWVKAEALVCRYCQRSLRVSPSGRPAPLYRKP